MIEMVLVITLMGLIASVGALAFSPVLDSWSLGSSRSEAVGSASYALHRMTSEISQLKDAQSVITASSGTLQFIDLDDNNITYVLTGDQLMRNGEVLARNVQSLNFDYWDINNVSLVTPQVSPATTDIWRIAVNLTEQSGNQTVTFESQVRPRNLPRP